MTNTAREASEEMQRLLEAAQAGPDDAAAFTVAGQRLTPPQVIEILAPYLTEERRSRIDVVLAGRTYGVVPVVEGLINTGNVSAVMRTAEALGFQAFHIIMHDEHDEGIRYKTSGTHHAGGDKWLDVWRWPSPEACVAP